MLPAAPVLNHLWQSTVVAAVIALVTLVFRRDRAQIRHALWLAASLKLLVPFAALRWIGLQLPAPPWPSPADAVPIGVQVIASPFSRMELTAFPHAIETAAVVPDLAPHVPLLLLVLWILGAMVVAASWANGWRALRRIRREAAHPTSSREAMLLRRLEQQRGARCRS
jgi:beta-lactamase regulating signal transducer with metallopeptidase domain